MSRSLCLSLIVGVVSAAAPGGFTSFSEALLKHGVSAMVPKLVHDIKDIVIPGVNQTSPIRFWIDPIRFQDVSIGSYDVSVISGKGVQVSLLDMSNVIAHTGLMVDVGFIKCTGEIWASATGASFKAMNTIVVDEAGNGKLKTVTTPGDFDAGSIEVHHKMHGFICEAAADILHIVNGVVIDLLKKTLQSQLADLVAKIVDTSADLLLHEIEQPPALGFGKEKFKLDNSYLGVSYDGHRITHLHKNEFKSTLHPQESSRTPPELARGHARDVQFGFSDYMVNTLFDAMFAEHIGEGQIKIPFIKTLFDKECPKCPIVIQTSFGAPAHQYFINNRRFATSRGEASVLINNMAMTIGALNDASKVLPMVTLSVNASAGVAFSLVETAANYGVKAKLSLGDLQQQLLISHIGKVDLSDLTRDLKLVITSLFDTLNKDVPALPIPSIAGVKLGRPVFTIGERNLLLEADVIVPDRSLPVILV